MTNAYIAYVEYYDEYLDEKASVDFVVFGKSYKSVEKQINKEFKNSDFPYEILVIEKIEAIPLF